MDEPVFTLEQQLSLSRELARLVRARLPLDAALAELGREGSKTSMQAAELLRSKLAAGQSLTHSLARGRSRPAQLLAAAIEVGERSGRLDAALESWTGLYMNHSRLTRRLMAALVYPAVTILVATLSISFTAWELVPHYGEAFIQFSERLPPWFEWISYIRQRLWVLNALLIVGLMSLFVAWWRRRNRWDSLGLPIDPSLRCYFHAHMARLAAMGVQSGRPMSQLCGVLLPVLAGTDRPLTSWQSALGDDSSVALMGNETVAALACLEAGAIQPRACEEMLTAIANQMERQGSLLADRSVSWLPMVLSIIVGVVAIAAYLGLIYLPWLLLYYRIID